jgi:parallel beta-helix repeat protein
LLSLWTKLINTELLIILDQLEEYFLYQDKERQEDFFIRDFAQAVSNQELRVQFLISIREDMLSQLDRFKPFLPGIFNNNFLRLRRLDRKGAEDAIRKPIQRANQLLSTNLNIKEELVQEILRQLESKKFGVGNTEELPTQKGYYSGIAEGRFEAPYIQLVMTRVWEEEMNAGSSILRLETLNWLGGVDEIAKTHLERQMEVLSERERDVCARMFAYLVTPSGAKIAYSVNDLASFAKASKDEVRAVLEKLSQGQSRILNPLVGESFEIFHDVLAQPVLDWRTRYFQDKDKLKAAQAAAERERKMARVNIYEARRQSLRRRNYFFIALLASLVLGTVTIFQIRLTRLAMAEREKSETLGELLLSLTQPSDSEEEFQNTISEAQKVLLGEKGSFEYLFTTIQGGETFELEDGEYILNEPVYISRSVTFKGKGRDKTIISYRPRGSSDPAIRFNSRDGRLEISGVTIQYDNTASIANETNPTDFSLLHVSSGEVEIHDSNFINSIGSGAILGIRGVPSGVTAQVLGSTFLNNAVGITLYGDASANLTGNSFVNNLERGISFQNSSSGIVSNNKIFDNSAGDFWQGIGVEANASPMIENNVIEGNGGYGVQFRDSSTGVLRNNTIRGNGANLPSDYKAGQVAIGSSKESDSPNPTIESNDYGDTIIDQQIADYRVQP